MVIPVRAKSLPSLWLLLPGQTVLFVVWQVVIALILTFMGSANGWEESAGWWPPS